MFSVIDSDLGSFSVLLSLKLPMPFMILISMLKLMMTYIYDQVILEIVSRFQIFVCIRFVYSTILFCLPIVTIS